jgi:hypothetical protein
MNAINRILVLSTAVISFSASAFDPADQRSLLDHLNRSSSEFLQAIQVVTTEQWNYKPAADVWSVAECAEHIILSEDLIRDMIQNKVLNAPAIKARPGETRVQDKQVLDMVTDRSSKAKAPEPLQPKRTFASPEAAAKAFRETRAKTIAMTEVAHDLRSRVGPHPVLKELDAHQWLLYLSGHTMRHTAQIREVKAGEGFPGAR